MIPVLNTALRIVQGGGLIERSFHRWLQQLQRRLDGPIVGDQLNVNAVVDDGQFGIHAKRLEVPVGGRVKVLGTGRLVICG